MHELSVCRALLRQVLAVSQQHAAPVGRVTVRIGPLSGIDPDLLSRAYPIATADSPIAGSVLAIETVPIRVRCSACDAETAASSNRLTCGACGDWHTTLLSGDEMLLLSVELKEPLHV